MLRNLIEHIEFEPTRTAIASAMSSTPSGA